MIKVQKDAVVKEITPNVLDEYLRLGWELVKETGKKSKPFAENPNNEKL